MEVYERNQLGISYLTDSINFKIYVGQLNFENEYYSYKCILDSIYIFKISREFGNDSRYDTIINEYRYSIKDMKMEKRFDE